MEHWNKGALPCGKMAEFFRSGHNRFALGEMRGKALRSDCMFHRYTRDPELKAIMDAALKDLLSTERENGTRICTRLPMKKD